MFRSAVAVLISFIVSATAFVPASRGVARNALKMGYENEIGVQQVK